MPEIPRFVKVATPFTAVTDVVPTRVAPADTVAVTTDVESVVTVLPEESLIAITGWVVKAEPEAKPAAAVLWVNWVALPEPESVKPSEVTPPADVPVPRTAMRYVVPTVPENRVPEKLSTPEAAVAEFVPEMPVVDVVDDMKVFVESEE